MAVPVLDPGHHTDPVLDGSGGFRPGDRVWLRTGGSWRPGVVLHSSQDAATVRYRPAEGRGTGVDTVTKECLALREDDDPFLDVRSDDIRAGGVRTAADQPEGDSQAAEVRSDAA
jgi:hypothetical protein